MLLQKVGRKVWVELNGCIFFFFQAEDGIRDAQESRGLGDVYKRQDYTQRRFIFCWTAETIQCRALSQSVC